MATPTSSTPANSVTRPRDSAQHRLEIGALAGFDAADLMATYDALHAALEAVNGVINQPRCSTAGRRSLTAAGDELETLAEHLGRCAELVVKAADANQPADASDRETRSWLLLKAGVHLQDDLSQFAIAAARSAAENARAGRVWE